MSSYDHIAEWYEDYATEGKGKLVATLVSRMLNDLLPVGDGALCVDLGVGAGVQHDAVVGRGWTHVGVDISQALLTLAAARGVTPVRGTSPDFPSDPASCQRSWPRWSRPTWTDSMRSSARRNGSYDPDQPSC